MINLIEPTTLDDLRKGLRCEGEATFVAFRGVGRQHGNLKTGIQRLQSANEQLPSWDLLSRERRLLDNFRVYAAEHREIGASDWDIIAIARHFLLPTRLLDWTTNPYVALFFATEDREYLKCDGEVWCVSRRKTNEFLPQNFKEALNRQLGYQLFYLETLREMFPRLTDLDQQSSNALIWFEPPSMNPRIVNQYAFFSVMPKIDTSTSDYLESLPKVAWRVVVPAKLKSEIKGWLGTINITHRTMYPGLDGIAKWLTEFYNSPHARRYPPGDSNSIWGTNL